MKALEALPCMSTLSLEKVPCRFFFIRVFDAKPLFLFSMLRVFFYAPGIWD
jgi:hypothetical protein